MSSDQSIWGEGRYGQFQYTPDTDYWHVDDSSVLDLVSETRTWQALELTFRVDSTDLDDRLKHLQQTAGKFEIVPASDGSFTTLDRSGTDSVVTLVPPDTRTPPRMERDYVVGQYQERPLDQSVSDFEVAITFVPTSNREPDYTTADETRAGDEWALDFRSAQIATKRVQAEIVEGVNTSTDTVELTLVCTAEQTKVIEESATRQAAATVLEVPDGPNTVDDDAPNRANSVLVTTPDGTDPIADGEYVVMGWQTEWLSAHGYRVSLTLSPSDRTRTGWNWGQWGQFQYGQLTE